MAGKPKPPKNYVAEGSGRPSKFTPEIRAAIIDNISHRIPYALAAEANGINEETFYEWLKIGKEHNSQGIESDYSIFSKKVKEAELARVVEHSDSIAKSPERWQAHAWLLERRWHKHYSPNASLHDLTRELMELKAQIQNGNNNGNKNGES